MMATKVWAAMAAGVIGMSGSRRTMKMITGRNATHIHQIESSYAVTRSIEW